ncbi:hypothetical protein WKV44_06755 [Spirochaetia bacterium 38H-sp]|uniref:Uncharacterized protein n=1 Tax=Rarispira pelagica TaxID=3141764 RepID=A0ABU9UC45_9SPIR
MLRRFIAFAFFTILIFPVLADDDETILSDIEDVLKINISTKLVGLENIKWQVNKSKITIPGKAVTVKLISKDIVVLARLTPFKKKDGSFIVLAEGQVWCSQTGEDALKYLATVKQIPLNLGEKIIFFPLGKVELKAEDESLYRLEIEIWIDDTDNEESHKPPSASNAIKENASK